MSVESLWILLLLTCRRLLCSSASSPTVHADCGMTDEEQALMQFTRSRMKKLCNWSEWVACNEPRLDHHYETCAVLDPVLRSFIKSVQGSAPDGVLLR